jgi:uncharacterized protein (TIGR00369 family)
MTNQPIQEEWPEEASFCWGCGKNNTHGLQLQSFWDAEETVATWTPQEHHLAFPGILNGGIIATLIDCHGTGTANAAAHMQAAEEQHDSMHVTASIKVNYLRPTPLDTPLTLRARVIETDGRKTTVTCSLFSGDVECANGTVKTVKVSLKDFLS